jgi:hypothetical protein
LVLSEGGSFVNIKLLQNTFLFNKNFPIFLLYPACFL